ncbi:MAG: DNA polymerase IV [Actinobacteria bacterium]|nr:MAG: DNA polymerase IV [Actinomycetota bacterium]
MAPHSRRPPVTSPGRGYTHSMPARDAASGLWKGRAVLHVDMDAFFASVEQLDHPEWRGRAVVVGGSPQGRGVIAAASYEARAYGVHSAMSAARAARLLPADAVWARGNFERYAQVSAAIRALFEAETPHVRMASVDEAYLDVTPSEARPEHPVAVARRLIDAVDAMGLSCSVGVATSATVAKIASDRDKPHGLTVVPPGTEAEFLAPLAVGLMPGVGAVSQERLVSHGVLTLGDLAALDDATARDLVGSGGPDLVRRARGVDPTPVRPREAAKSVSREHTFATDLREEGEVLAELTRLTDEVCARMRRKGVAGRTVTVKLRYSDFTTRVASRTVATATDSPEAVLAAARETLRSAWTPGTGLRLLGVGVSHLVDPAEQLDLFGEADAERRGRDERLGSSLEAIRERFGDGAVGVGLDGIGDTDT